jgi:hypothetical protein
MTNASQSDFADAWRKYKLLRNTLIALSFSFFLLNALEDVAVRSLGVDGAKAHLVIDGGRLRILRREALRSRKCPQCGKSFYGGRKS